MKISALDLVTDKPQMIKKYNIPFNQNQILTDEDINMYLITYDQA